MACFRQVSNCCKRPLKATTLAYADKNRHSFLSETCILLFCVISSSFLSNAKSISGQIFGLISTFFINRWLWVFLDGKSSQEYPVNAGVAQSSILGPTLFLLYINDLPDVICNIVIYADDATLHSKFDQASDM